MADRAQLTVAVPTYNGARHVGEAVRSILNQEGVAFDVIVCDDRSDDETLSVVRRAAGDRARILVNSERLGLARNWNRCVDESDTPFVAVFHQDDLMHPAHLASHVAALRDNDQTGFACSAVEVIDAAGKNVPPTVVERGGFDSTDREFGPGEAIPRLTVNNPIRCSAVTLRAAAHADVGGFDPSYRYVVDWDFWARVAKRWGIAWRARPSVSMRWHSESETHRFKSGTADLEEVARLQDALLREDGAPAAERNPHFRDVRRRRSRAYLNRAYEALRGGDATLAQRCLFESFALWPGSFARSPRILASPRK